MPFAVHWPCDVTLSQHEPILMRFLFRTATAFAIALYLVGYPAGSGGAWPKISQHLTVGCEAVVAGCAQAVTSDEARAVAKASQAAFVQGAEFISREVLTEENMAIAAALAARALDWSADRLTDAAKVIERRAAEARTERRARGV
jgi:hypothetical protein